MGLGFIRRFRHVVLLRSAVITPLRCAKILPNAGFDVRRRGRYSATVFASRLAPVQWSLTGPKEYAIFGLQGFLLGAFLATVVYDAKNMRLGTMDVRVGGRR